MVHSKEWERNLVLGSASCLSNRPAQVGDLLRSDIDENVDLFSLSLSVFASLI